MKVLNPLAIRYIGLPSRDVLHMVCVHQSHFDIPLFEDLEKGNPVHAR